MKRILCVLFLAALSIAVFFGCDNFEQLDKERIIKKYNPQIGQVWECCRELQNPFNSECGEFKIIDIKGDYIKYSFCKDWDCESSTRITTFFYTGENWSVRLINLGQQFYRED